MSALQTFLTKKISLQTLYAHYYKNNTSNFVILDQIDAIIGFIDASIKDDPAQTIQSGNIIKDGYNEKVDHYRGVIQNAHEWLSQYTQELCDQTNISNLKIKYTSASGYFIEVSKSHISKVPDTFVHKQTLVNAARFITPELQQFTQDLIDAEGNSAQVEYDLFQEIREDILQHFDLLQSRAHAIANTDFITSLAACAYSGNYCRPQIHDGYDLSIEGGRHPVIETIESEFIRNDLALTSKDFTHIITGPNMGGKSTFLRQNALIILMAHMGSFVPASSAKIPLTDKIFSRVGASDNLYLGASTFMVEMQEVSNILKNSTPNSFVIIDEVGRGTSTYDGMSLAWAILRYNHDIIKAKTLFATHYHELVDESVKLGGVKNYSISVGEDEDENLIFLRKIIPGGAKKSYGLQVAKLAGVPKEVLQEAQSMMKNLEQEHTQMSLGTLSQDPPIPLTGTFPQREKEKSQLEQELEDLDVNNLTPIDALNLVSKWKNK